MGHLWLIVCTLKLLIGSAGASTQTNEPWTPLVKEIFEKGGKNLQPEETLELLEQLKKVLSEVDFKTKDEVYSLYKKTILLIARSHADLSKCKWSYVQNLLAQQNRPGDSENISAYLKYCWTKQLKACEDYLGENLRISVELLGATNLKRIESLRSNVEKASVPQRSGFSRQPLAALTKGVLNYMEPHIEVDNDHLLAGNQGRWLFQQEYKNLVLSVCRSVDTKLNTTVDSLRLFSLDPKVSFKTIGTFANYWIKNLEICREIFMNEYLLSTQLYKEFQRRRTSLKERLIRCFTL